MKSIYIAIVIAALCMACDPFANPRYAPVTFSSDTLFFDTIFTSLGSTTMEVRAKNPTDKPMLISEIRLAGGDDSPFRININGMATSTVRDITIAANDSIFLFVDAVIDPSGDDLPVSVLDSIMFFSGSYFSRVILQAWGQDIILIKDDTINSSVWSSGKPYVIYGSVLIDTTETLLITGGTKVFFHNDASMVVAGNIIVSGTEDQPVILASDRTSAEYEDIPGQWSGIIFRACSRGNKITDAVIRNADIALAFDGDHITGRPDIEITNTSVIHNSISSIKATYSDIKAVNSLFAHTGFSTVNINDGSNVSFIHCTVYNNWGYNIRSASSISIGRGTGEASFFPSVAVYNSVVGGDLASEIDIAGSSFDVADNILFDSCFVKLDTLRSTWWNRNSFKGVSFGADPRFINSHLYDFRPDTLSPLQDVAGKIYALPYSEDIRHKPRPRFNGPDIGAYERQPGEKRE